MPLIIALSLPLLLSLSPSFHASSPFSSFLSEAIMGSEDSFMTFILLGTSLSLPSVFRLSPSSHHPSLFLLITLAVLSVDTLQTCRSLS